MIILGSIALVAAYGAVGAAAGVSVGLMFYGLMF